MSPSIFKGSSICVCMHRSVCVCTGLCMYAQVYVFTGLCVYVQVCVCMRSTYVCTGL
jgi:hypothetical protein